MKRLIQPFTQDTDSDEHQGKVAFLLLLGLQLLIGFALFAEDSLGVALDRFLRFGLMFSIYFMMIVVFGVSKAQEKLARIGKSER